MASTTSIKKTLKIDLTELLRVNDESHVACRDVMADKARKGQADKKQTKKGMTRRLPVVTGNRRLLLSREQ